MDSGLFTLDAIMKFRLPHVPPAVAGWLVAIVVVVSAFATRGTWIPATESWVDNTLARFRGGSEEESDDDAEAEHAVDAHGGHDEATSLELSTQARRNIGLTDGLLQEVRLQTFRRAITVPAMVVERPGRTQIQVATPMTGVITHVHAVTGESVESGSLLFQIRLTHEDLVQVQTDFLKTIGELDVERREVKRLTAATSTGAVAKIKLIERQYEEEKLEALLRAQQEALRLHGLSDRQVQQIVSDRRLLRELQIVVPFPDKHSDDELRLTGQAVHRVGFQEAAFQSTQLPDPDKLNAVKVPQAKEAQQAEKAPLVLTTLNVHKGQAVSAGETLCVLSDMRQLYIEGQAFEQDMSLLEHAAGKGWPMTAIQPTNGQEPVFIENLQVAYLDNRVSVEDRSLRFYVGLPNSILRTTQAEDGQRFISWKFKPGQRMQLRVPVEEWADRIVLPVDAVAKEGAEFFVFMENGDHFDRRTVHVEYRDQFNVVVANDGSLFEGDVVAFTGAHQMQMALKNKSGGAIDPHAGHTH
jgi:membrane fusion protein, heavy metal efflux system